MESKRSATKESTKAKRSTKGLSSFRPCSAMPSTNNKTESCSKKPSDNYNKTNIILPRLNRIRPSTTSYSFKKAPSSTNKPPRSRNTKQNQDQKQHKKGKTEMLQNLKSKSSQSIDLKICRPSTAPLRNKEFTRRHYYYDKKLRRDVEFSHKLRKESFNLKQEEKEQKRCEIYAINNVMKQVFQREFDEYMNNKKRESNA